MKTEKTKGIRIFFLTLGILIIAVCVLDAIFFNVLSETGVISLGICVIAMAASFSRKPEAVQIDPKRAKIFASLTIVLIVSGLVTFFLVI